MLQLVTTATGGDMTEGMPPMMPVINAVSPTVVALSVALLDAPLAAHQVALCPARRMRQARANKPLYYRPNSPSRPPDPAKTTTIFPGSGGRLIRAAKVRRLLARLVAQRRRSGIHW